ncbi:MAG: DUF5615 family PIN-like protein [Gammaproteobacteria bacterium]
MRLLFDENLSFRLVRELADIYPDSLHVRDVGLLGAADQAVWAYAAQQGLLLTSKDTDFYQQYERGITTWLDPIDSTIPPKRRSGISTMKDASPSVRFLVAKRGFILSIFTCSPDAM